MKPSIFSKGLFIEALRKLKVVSIISLAVIVFNQVVLTVASNAGDTVSSSYTLPVLGPADIAAPLVYIPVIIAPVMMMILFSSFNKRGSSDFYLALPYTRNCLAFTWTAAVLAVSFALFLIGTALGYVAYAFYPELYIIEFTGMISVVLTFLAAIVFAIGACLVAVSVTGKLFSAACAAILIMYLPRCLMMAAREVILSENIMIAGNYAYGFLNYKTNVFIALFPSVYEKLMFSFLYGYEGNVSGLYSEPGPIAYTLIVGIVLTALGIFLFAKRRGETAGNAADSKRINAAIRIALGFAVSSIGTLLYLTMSSYKDAVTVAVVIYIAAVLTYFAYEIIATGKWKNVLKSAPGLLIAAALNIALAICVTLGIKAGNAYVNDYGAISSVTYMTGYETENGLMAAFSKAAVTDPEALEITEGALKASHYIYAGKGDPEEDEELKSLLSGTRQTFGFIRIDTDKGVRYLRTLFTKEEYEKLLGIIINTDAYLAAVRDIPEMIDETAEASMTIYTSSSGGAGQTDIAKSELVGSFRTELLSLDDASLASYASAAVLGNYGDDSIFGIGVRENVPGFTKYFFYISPLYFPKTTEAAFGLVTGSSYDAGAIDEILKEYERCSDLINESIAEEKEDTESRYADTIESYFDLNIRVCVLNASGMYDIDYYYSMLDLNYVYNDYEYDYDESDSENAGTTEEYYEYYEDEGTWDIIKALQGTGEPLSCEKFITIYFYYYNEYGRYTRITGVFPLTDAVEAVLPR